VGLFPANTVGYDDIEVYSDNSRTSLLTVIHTLRQQMQNPENGKHKSLADYIAPKESGIKDFIGAFAVTAGIGADELSMSYKNDNDDFSAIMVKVLADRLAEAFAEYLHFKVRTELWAYSGNEKLNEDELLKEKYIGIRPAPGYPALPDHTEKELLFDLLDAEKRTGIKLTESMFMTPAASVSGFYFAHPEIKYFPIGKIGRDQVLDYRKRKGMSIENIEKWLSQNLGY
jgi:5-methyltetrahydrofolate--homocysteine methyltransferase